MGSRAVREGFSLARGRQGGEEIERCPPTNPTRVEDVQ